MDVTIKPSKLYGSVYAIGSKSDLHRLLICAALSDKETDIILSGSMTTERLSEDIKATISCLNSLGATITTNEKIHIVPIREANDNILDCRESGSTLRFMLPVASAVCESASFTGSGRLPSRPIKELREAMESGGVTFSAPTLPFTICGKLKSGKYYLPGNVSSQYITGLLLSLAAIEGRSEIILTSPLQSAAYIDITISAMQKFNVYIEKTENGYIVPNDTKYQSPGTVIADGDWSNAAFFLALKSLGQEVSVLNLTNESPQGDKAIISMLINISKGNATISLQEIPDLLPIMAVAACFAPEKTEFIDGKRLRIKESDRLTSVCNMINDLGGKAEEKPEGIIIYPSTLSGGTVNSENDHRIVMAASIAATSCTGPVTILGAEAINKSYPTFFDDYKKLGGEIQCH
ncbi:MAG: 3-phosphoshikimate 1-carboxyvinyltransferase [Oscillospiraceae bacterium]|nr:3-phosphoshikimate 1-carboxyvinyltransferase [Oscillospiraceae bacterium]